MGRPSTAAVDWSRQMEVCKNMPKMKTHRGAAKRFSKTGSGKIKRSHSFRNHMFSAKSPKQKRQLRRSTTMAPGDVRRLKQLLAYL